MAKKAKSEHPLSKADRSEIMSEFKTNNDLLGGQAIEADSKKVFQKIDYMAEIRNKYQLDKRI